MPSCENDPLSTVESRPTNTLLACLPSADFERLRPLLKAVLLKPKQVLHPVNEPSGQHLEMTGMRLTPAHVHRLCGIDAAICKRVLDDLVLAKFLDADDDGVYARGSESVPRSQTAKVDLTARPVRVSDRVS
jgi:hypothetical protein